jgi:hypothetical protein
MASPAPRRRRSAVAPISATVKSSIVVSRELHSRWQAAASIAGMTANAFAVDALSEALRGIVIVDRRKTSDRPDTSDRPVLGLSVDSDEENAA